MFGFVIDSSKKYFNGKSFACFSGVLENKSHFTWYQEIPEIFGFEKTIAEDPQKDPNLRSLSNDFIKPIQGYFEERKSTLKENIQTKIFENRVNAPLIWLAQNVGVSLKFLTPPHSIKSGQKIFINPKVEASTYIPEISTLSIDIEVGMKSSDILDVANNTLYCIAIHSKFQSTVLMLDESIAAPSAKNLEEFVYKIFPNEKALLEEFIQCVSTDSSQIFLGWSVLEFDLQFLCKKIQLHGLELRLGMLGKKSNFSVSGNKNFRLYLGGRSILDGIWLLKEMEIKLPNYKLNTTAEILLNERKTIVSTDVQKIEEIDYLFENDKEALATYNFKDAILPTKILNKIDGIPFLISKSILSKTPFSYLSSQQILADSLYIPILRKYFFVAPEIVFKQKKGSSQNLEEIIPFKIPTKGIHKNILKIEFEELDIFVIKNFPIDILTQINSIDKAEKNSVFFEIKHAWDKIIKKFSIQWQEKKSIQKSISSLYKNLLYSITSPLSRYYNLGVISYFQKIKAKILNQLIENLSKQINIEIIWIGKNFIFIKNIENLCKESVEKSISAAFSSIRIRFSEKNNLHLEKISNKVSFFSNLFFLNTDQNEKTKYLFSYALQNEFADISIFPYFEKTSIKFPQKVCHFFLKDLFDGKTLEISLQKILKELFSGNLNEYLIYVQKLGKEFNKTYPDVNLTPHSVLVGKELGLKKSGYVISYVITKSGAKPYLGASCSLQLEYEYYKNKYILPIYKVLRTTLEEVTRSISSTQQMGFFD